MEINSVTASESRDQFLQLLVTQLRHQDPLDPIKQEDFLSQLAQFSTLEGIEKLNDRFDQQLAIQQESLNTQRLTQAAQLVGREVIYHDSAADGEAASRSGTIESVMMNGDRIQLRVGGVDVNIEQISTLLSPSESTPPVATTEPDQSGLDFVSEAIRRKLSSRIL